ncbi:MAG: O-antigen polysaccharide polymerase Wzy [Bacteroidetes bacterium]|nr:O-antigen polysaccharide polymerase Wzy [Bacteroidota bacterium]
MSYSNRIVVAILTMAASVALFLYAPAARSSAYSLYVSLVSAACIYLNVRHSVRGLWSASSIFIIIFWCFHFGVILSNAFGLNIASVTGNDIFWQWIDSPFYTKAEGLALIGIAAFSLITVLRSNHLPEKPEEETESLQDSRYFKPLLILAYVLVLGGIGGWLYIMLSMGGVQALFAGYAFYLRFIEDYPSISIVYWAIGVGLAMLGVVNDWRRIRVGFIIFITWSLIAFIMGLRGEVLYPACAFLVTFARQRQLSQKPVLLVIPVVLLSLISFVRVFRVDETVNAESFNPLYGLLELGGSLQTVVIAEEWINDGTDHFRYGETIIAPFDRMLDRVTLSQRVDADQDFRLMNVAMGERNGPYGFSPVAEGYMNLGALGVAILMALLSLLLNFFDSKPSGIFIDPLAGGITFILFTFIRNSFSHIPGQTLLLAGIIMTTYGIFRKR